MFYLPVLLIFARVARAQGTTAVRADTSASWPQRVWLFAGLGAASIPTSSLAAVAGVSYSPGPLIVSVRRSGAAQLFGDGIDEHGAVLARIRSRGKRAFVSAQLGPSQLHRYHTCDGPCGSQWTGPTSSALAFDPSATANYVIAGAGLDIFGTLVPSSVLFYAAAVIIQLGWFGN